MDDERARSGTRDLEEPWRVRRAKEDNFGFHAHESVVRVETPQQRNATAAQSKKPRKQQAHSTRTAATDPLEVCGQCAERSKEQVDALEKMLHSAMPPRVVLDNSFAGLRNTIADEIELGMESQWRKGVKHGEWLAANKIMDLEAEVSHLRTGYCDLQLDYTKMLVEAQQDVFCPSPRSIEWEPPKTALQPLLIQDEEEDLLGSLARWLEEIPRDPNGPPEIQDRYESPECHEIDLDAMSREIESIQDVICAEA